MCRCKPGYGGLRCKTGKSYTNTDVNYYCFLFMSKIELLSMSCIHLCNTLGALLCAVALADHLCV